MADVSSEDEHLMRRFLCDDVMPEEREALERRLIEDASYGDALCALEDEMLLGHVQDTLDAEWRTRFAAAVGRSAVLRRKVDETRLLVEALEVESARASRGRRILIAAAAVVAMAIAGGLMFRRPDLVSQAPSSTHTAAAPRQFGQEVVLPLLPNVRRDRAQSNIARLQSADTLRLTASLEMATAADERLEARIRTPGGGHVAISTRSDIRRAGGVISLSWSIPSTDLAPGDYILSVLSVRGPAREDVLGDWFFSVVQ